jgi:arylformamidase
MKIYDISQEVFGCVVYPGDPTPTVEKLESIANGSSYNLTAFSMCVHNGTHVDAPNHFYLTGKTIDEIGLELFVGGAYVVTHDGDITSEDAIRMVTRAREVDMRSARRILIKGKAVVTSEAAEAFIEAGIILIGNESQTVGPEEAPMKVHLQLLGAGVVILEGIRLDEVPDGAYFLNAAPLNLGGADGAPCRAILIDGI